MSEIEQKYDNIGKSVEHELSLKSDFELRVIKDQEWVIFWLLGFDRKLKLMNFLQNSDCNDYFLRTKTFNLFRKNKFNFNHF